MCGGFIVAYTSTKIDDKWNPSKKAIAHLLYHLGRITSYIIIGMVFGALGSIFIFSKTALGSMYIIIALIMLLMGLSLLGKIKFLTFLECDISKDGFFKKIFSKLIKSKSLGSLYFLGMLNGFLPCGLVYFFAASSAVTASVLWGGVTMAIFGIATVPSLLAFGALVGFMKDNTKRQIMLKISSYMIILFSFYMLHKGYWFLTDPFASIHTCH
jgi:sulfite exporter TauE/SafE